MISLGMNTIYTISDELCQTILGKIDRIKEHPKLHESHFLERLRYLFIRHCDASMERRTGRRYISLRQV